MKNLNDILTFLLATKPLEWFRDFSYHQWVSTIISYPNSKCKLCGLIMAEFEPCMYQHKVGVLHLPCFESCNDWQIIRDNALTSARQALLNYYKNIGGI